MSLSVAGKYAVITGAGSGINLAFAKMLLERGCSVMIGDLTLRPDASSLLAQYPHPQQPNRPSALFQPTNVSSWPQLTRLWKKTLTSFPRVDIVVPGAGIFEPAWSSFWNPRARRRIRRRSLATGRTRNPLAIGHWTQERRKGCLVHVSSIAGHASGIGTPLYFASKHGLHGFVRCLGGMRDRLGIRCGAVAPGAVMTPLWLEDPGKKHLAQGESGELFIEPEEIARGMLELCENPEYGDGTILEVTKGATRVVPAYHAEPPGGKGAVIPQIADEAEKVWKELEGKGLKV
ncbi:NAD-dependent 15-hydroxyprostaglandin dehydrogenase [Colletotrichum tofieldiae]|nr:NAD-dependent 15-hydroxyprostaglandin dehydrogenase [Colletotrichum tofieldiae]